MNIISFPFCCDLKCILLKIGSFFSKITKNEKGEKKTWGFAPHPPGRPGAFCLFAGLLAVHDCGDRRLHSTQVRHHTLIDLSIRRVCIVQHMMITTQVRHHTHLDLSTCRVCAQAVKHMMIMRQYFPRLWYDPTHCMRVV